MTVFDSAFILARVDQCIAICQNHAGYNFDQPDLFIKAYEQGLSWLNNHGHKTGLMPFEISDLKECFYDFYAEFLKVRKSNEEFEQVSESAPSAQMSVLRLLGSINTSCSVCEKSSSIKPLAAARIARLPAYWTPPSTITKQLLSNTRPVGGLA